MKYLLSLILLTSMAANATTANDVKISKVKLDSSAGRLLVELTPAPANAGCQTNANYQASFDYTSDMGKSLLSMALTAYSTQQNVNIVLKSTCDSLAVKEISNMELF